MSAFADIDDIHELKKTYRRLAARWHPDRGGNADMMQRINVQYDAQLERLLHQLKADAGTDFSYLEIGYTVWVNGTECEVTDLSESSFRVVAKGRTRQAVFDRATGCGKFNPRLRASFDNRHRKHRH